MLRVIYSAILITFTVSTIFSQTATEWPPFEAASIKAYSAGSQNPRPGRPPIQTSPESVSIQYVSLMYCLTWAYDVKEISGPEWIRSERYDLFAKVPRPVPEAQLKLIVQTLLAEKFKLK